MRKTLGYIAVIGALFYLFNRFKEAQKIAPLKIIQDEE